MDLCEMCLHQSEAGCTVGSCDERDEFTSKPLYKAAPDMFEALKQVEYSAQYWYDECDSTACCPECEALFDDPHKSDCIIGRALAKAEGRQE